MVDADGNWGKDSGTVTITLSAEEQDALNNAISAIATVAATDAGTTYQARESGGISEANHNRILEAYAAGKNVNIVVAFGDVQLTLIPTAYGVDNTSGSLKVSCAAFGQNVALMDVRVDFVCGYDSPSEGESLYYFTVTTVALCVPKTVD